MIIHLLLFVYFMFGKVYDSEKRIVFYSKHLPHDSQETANISFITSNMSTNFSGLNNH